MTKTLPKPNVQVSPKRMGPPRLTAPERQALKSIEDPTLRQVLGEFFITARANQDNFDEITQWFPVQPADAAYALKDQIVFRYTLREGFLEEGLEEAFFDEPGVIEFFDQGGVPQPSMEQIEKVRVGLDDQEERGFGHLFHYISVLGDEEHRGMVMMVGQESGAFCVFELTSEATPVFGSLYKEASVVPIVAGPNSPDFIYGEQVAIFSIGAVQGAAGADGAEGRSAGLKYTYSNNTASSDPGAGKLKFNNTVFTEATLLRISETDGDGNNIAAVLGLLDDSTSTVKGTITLRKVGDPTKFAVFTTSGVLNDNGTWDSLTVAHVASNGLVNNDVVMVEFARTGDKGEQGAKGEKGEKGEAGAAAGDLVQDSVAQSAAGTGTLEWEHVFAEPDKVRGVLVLIVANDATPSDEVNAVTISGTAMEEIPSSPFLHSSGSEDGVVYGYFLGRGIPEAGGGFMKVTVSGATVRRAVSIAISADADLRVEGVGTQDAEATTVPTVEFSVGSHELIAFGALHSGADSPSGITGSGSYTKIAEHDFGTQSAVWVSRPAHKPTNAEQVALAQGSDEAGLLGVAIGRVRDHGIVTALPAVAGKGDVCTFVADSTNGVYWHLLYDGEGSYPWKVISGVPLASYSGTDREGISSTAWASFTSAPLVTVPLKGEYRALWGATSLGTQGAGVSVLGLRVAGVDPSNAGEWWKNDDISYVDQSATSSIPAAARKKVTLAATNVVEVRHRAGSGANVFARNPWLEVHPTRVG